MPKKPIDYNYVVQRINHYQQDPVGFMTEVLSLPQKYVWDKMVEVAEAIRDHQLVAIRAGHSVSKTFTMGRIVTWYKTCWQPSTVVTTAPSDHQVRGQLWREIHASVAGSKVPLGGKLTTLQWDVKPSGEVLSKIDPLSRESWMKNFATGFSTSPDSTSENATKMQGWHNEHVLVVIDEACGINPVIWRTALESLITDENCKMVAIGNPTDPDCDFAKACYSSDPDLNEGNEPYTSDEGWHVVTIAATDTPNYKEGKRVIPGLASKQWVEKIIKKYGPNGDGTRYRVKGLFPTHKEGTYFGQGIAKAYKDGRIGEWPHDSYAKVYTFSDFGDMYTGTIFVQFLRGMIRIIDDYWDYEGCGLPAWHNVITSKPYNYAGHYGGAALVGGTPKSFQTGKTINDVAAGMGIHLESVLDLSFDVGIEAGRGIMDFIQIDKKNAPTYLKAISGYGKKKNNSLSTDDQVVYHDQPAKTWHRHLADAHRHLAIAFRYMDIGGEYLGDVNAAAKYAVTENYEDEEYYDLLEL